MADLPVRALGPSGLEVSLLGLGANNFGRRVDLEGTGTTSPTARRRSQTRSRRSGTRLAGRDRVASEEQFVLLDVLSRFAEERGVTLLDVAIGWLVSNPVISSVMAGATRPDQVTANAAAARWRPSEEDHAVLNDPIATAA